MKSRVAFTLPGSRFRRMNVVGICLMIFLPWFLFCAVSALLTFSFHYRHPVRTWLLVALSFSLPLGTTLLAWSARKRGEGDPMWYLFASLALLLAALLGTIFGDANFHYNMLPFYDLEGLNTYPSVDPAVESGKALMDAGRVYFADGVSLDLKRAKSFKNDDLYCVAPIVNRKQKEPESYDFWAVGLNCCSELHADFRCGEFNNPSARSGVRLMRDEQRPFFRLAVQQLEACCGLKATHPLFFYWVQDAWGEMNSYQIDGFKYYFVGMIGFFLQNLFMVVAAVWGFWKINHH